MEQTKYARNRNAREAKTCLAKHLPETVHAVAVVLEIHLVQVNDVGAHAARQRSTEPRTTAANTKQTTAEERFSCWHPQSLKAVGQREREA